MNHFKQSVLSAIFCLLVVSVMAQRSTNSDLKVIAYFAGNPELALNVPAKKITHIIFSFCHLKGNRLNVDNARDTLTIQRLVDLKKKNPRLKVLLSLGGWGGCKTCSDVFSTAAGRDEFAKSVKELGAYFKTDGIDLDWEYPTIEGFPGHQYMAADKENFTALVTVLRKTLGKKQEISFAAGGFPHFLKESVDWKKVMQQVDYVNLMTYDLVNGYSTVTGHHTALYSTPQLEPSADNAVQYLLKLGIPARQLVLGAAFYARVWENVDSTNNGLYQQGKFKQGIPFKNFPTMLSPEKGFIYHWDDVAKAPYLYNPEQKLFATFDDKKSIQLKTRYAMDHHLYGIMFWQLTEDAPEQGLLDAIDQEKREYKQK